eukprot:PhF_6_TR40433/c0_g1_i2/m.60299
MESPRSVINHLIKEVDTAPLVVASFNPLQSVLTSLLQTMTVMREEQVTVRASISELWSRIDHIDTRVTDTHTLVDGTRADLRNVAGVDAVDAIAKKLQDLYSVIGELPTVQIVEEMQRDISTLRSVLESHAGDITKLVPTRVFQGVADEVTSIRHTLEKLPAPQALGEALERLTNTETTIKTVRKEVQDDLANVRDRFIQFDAQTRKNIQQRHDETTEQVLQVSRQCQESIRKQLKEEDSKYEELNKDISALKENTSAIAMLHARLQTLDASSQSTKELEKYHQRTSERVSIVETEIPRFREELTRLHEMAHSSAVLRPVMLDHVKEAEKLRNELSEVRATVMSVVGQMSTLSDHVAQMDSPRFSRKGSIQSDDMLKTTAAQITLLSERLHEVEKQHRVMDVRQNSSTMHSLQLGEIDERMNLVEKEMRGMALRLSTMSGGNDAQIRANASQLQTVEEQLTELDKQVRSLALRHTNTTTSLETQIKSTSSHVADFIDRVIDLEKQTSTSIIQTSNQSGNATENVHRAIEPFMISLKHMESQVSSLSKSIQDITEQHRAAAAAVPPTPPPKPKLEVRDHLEDSVQLLYRVFDIDQSTARLAVLSDLSERVRFVQDLPAFKGILRIVYTNTRSNVPPPTSGGNNNLPPPPRTHSPHSEGPMSSMSSYSHAPTPRPVTPPHRAPH